MPEQKQFRCAVYTRKSSEDEDRQILSIEAQVDELTDLAHRRNIEISEIYREAQSARRPGRPVFGKMMAAVERGKVTGILCWKPDRLARQSLRRPSTRSCADRKLG